jgi:PPOX class probable F420-dependent enzyme
MSTSPTASRPYMPGYGTKSPDEGSGLLPWSWAEEILSASPNYWVTTLGPDGSPHSTPVWGVWDGGAVWFSCAVGSRKARNLRADPRCCLSTERADNPVVIEGLARLFTDPGHIAGWIELANVKYSAEMPIEFLDPSRNALFEVKPVWAFALKHDDFEGSPTRWTFPER